MKKKLSFVVLFAIVFVLVTSACTTEKSAETGKADLSEIKIELTPGVIPTFDDIKIPADQKITIAYLSQSQTFQFQTYMGDAMKDEVAKYGGQVKMNIYDAQGVAATQVSQAEDAVVSGCDVVILNAVDSEACKPAVETIVNAGIPLITVNTEVTNNELAYSYVGVDDIDVGRILMNCIGEAIGGEGTINILAGQLGHPANERRRQGVDEVMKEKYPKISIAAMQSGDWERNRAMNVAEDWISSDSHPDGIIAFNDDMAIACANAYQAAGIKDIKIVSVDAVEEALLRVKDGSIYASVSQSANTEGMASVSLAICAALGVKVDPVYYIEPVAVTAELVDEYLTN